MEKDMHIKPDGPSVSTSPDEDLHATKEADGIRDVAADLFLEIGEYSPEELEAERTTVRKKLDMIIMPMYVDPHPVAYGTSSHCAPASASHTACNSSTSCPSTTHQHTPSYPI